MRSVFVQPAARVSAEVPGTVGALFAQRGSVLVEVELQRLPAQRPTEGDHAVARRDQVHRAVGAAGQASFDQVGLQPGARGGNGPSIDSKLAC